MYNIVHFRIYLILFNIRFISPFKEFVLSNERKHPELLKNFDDIFEIGLPLEMAHLDFDSEVRLH